MKTRSPFQRFEEALGVKNTREEVALIHRDGVNVKERTVAFSLSSEYPVYRMGFFENWYEILLHTKEAVDMTRAEGMSYLADHDYTRDIGVFEEFKLMESERKTRGRVRFGTDQLSEEYWKKHESGLRTKVSIGYFPTAYRKGTLDDVPKEYRHLITDAEAQIYLITNWQPAEGSSVTVPADVVVGVGRTVEPSQVERLTPRGGRAMDPLTAEEKAAIEKKVREEAETRSQEEIKKIREKAVKDMAEIKATAARFKGHSEIEKMAEEAIRSGMSAEDFKIAAFEKLNPEAVRTTESPEIGLSKKERQKYSLCKAILGYRTGGVDGLPGFERECHEAAAKKQPKGNPAGFVMPYDVMRTGVRLNPAERQAYEARMIASGLAKRDLNVTTDSQGGYLVDEELRTQDFIELLRNSLAAARAGVPILSGLVGDVAIPKQTGASVMYFLSNEGDPATPSTPALGQLALTPKTGVVETHFTKKLLLQASLDVEAWVRAEIARTIAIGMDAAIINGSGSNGEPYGILNTPSIGSVPLGTNGDVPTWAGITQLERDVDVANALMGTLAYLGNAKVKYKLKNTFKVANFDRFLMEDSPIVSPTGEGVLNGYRFIYSNQVPSNLTKNAGSNLSALLFGDFSQAVHALWGGIDIAVDEKTLLNYLTYRVVGSVFFDVGVRQPSAFSAIKDMVTT